MSQQISIITAFIYVLLIFGCTSKDNQHNIPMFRGNLKHSGVYNADEIKKLDELKWKFSCGHWGSSSPALADGNIYVGSANSCIYALY